MPDQRLRGALAVTAFVSFVSVGCAATPPEEEVGESGDFLLAGRVLKPSEVADHLRTAGFPENLVGKMTCVAKWESSYFERAQNGRHHGLWQISSLHLGEPGCPSNAQALYSASANAKCALYVYRAQGISAWEAYTKHKRECDAARAPGSAGPRPSGASVSSVPVDDPEEDDDAPTNDDNGGGCFSGTLGQMVRPHACVQSSSATARGTWFQCEAGLWYRGGDEASGPFGTCAEATALP